VIFRAGIEFPLLNMDRRRAGRWKYSLRQGTKASPTGRVQCNEKFVRRGSTKKYLFAEPESLHGCAHKPV
jgi:hypothetical protein